MIRIWPISFFILGHMLGYICKDTYILSRDCQIPPTHDPLLLYPNTKHLRIDLVDGGLVLYSHENAQINQSNRQQVNHSYPQGFSCEVVVYTPLKNAKIMLKIDKFFIPSNSKDCVDNYLYVFDSNNAKSKAMPEAGGERGLCQTVYPRFPIFTTNPFICIAFHTSTHPPIASFAHTSPGFRLILTAIRDTTTSLCQSGDFYCGPRPFHSHADGGSSLSLFSIDRRSYHHPATAVGGTSVSRRRDSSPVMQPSILAYCIRDRIVCDGIANCADGRDEDAERCKDSGLRTGVDRSDSDGPCWLCWLSRFLSLGIPASIAIAVATIVTFIICIGTIVCCCHRCCRPHSYARSSPRLTLSYPLDLTHSTSHRSAFGPSTEPLPHLNPVLPTDRTNLITWLDGTGDGSTGVLSTLVSSHQKPYVQPYHVYPVPKVVDPSSFCANRFPDGHLTGTEIPMQVVIAGSDGLTGTTETRATQQHSFSVSRSGHSCTPVQRHLEQAATGIGIPALLGSSDAYKRGPEHLAMDSCCYTPPPYGPCVVPPASSVTASSSRTGTTSGGGGGGVYAPNDLRVGRVARLKVSTDTSDYHVSSSVDVVGSSMCCESGNDFGVSGSTGMLFAQQLSGSGNSALHTNTPVETVSQGETDLISNGGIVYLGDVLHPFAVDNLEVFRKTSCGAGLAGSATTGSGSSHCQVIRSHRLSRHQEQPIHSTQQLRSVGHHRSRAPSHRQHRYRHQIPVNPARVGSSGSHTPASSRSHPRSTSETTDAQELPPPKHTPLTSSVSFPVQL